jgi:hypothetical protein
MSALPPKADIVQRGSHVRFVPKADSSDRSRRSYQLASTAICSWQDEMK